MNVLQNAHDNLISSMVVVGDNLFTASYSLIKVSFLLSKDSCCVLNLLNNWQLSILITEEFDIKQ